MDNKEIEEIKKGCGLELKDPPKGSAEYDIIFGTEVPQKPINWKEFLPSRERQYSVPFCVSFSRLNCGEAVARKQGIKLNLSDRHLGVLAGTGKSGTSMDRPSDAFRNKGVVKEEECKWLQEWLNNAQTYWATIFDLKDVRSKARRYFGGNYSWIRKGYKDKTAGIRTALAYSPVQLGIPIGETYNDSIVKPPERIFAYHAITCYYIDDYIYIQDSVSAEWKKLTFNYPIAYALSFRDLPRNWRNIIMPRLVRKKTDKKVYLETSRGRYWITNPEVFNDFRNAELIPDWDKVELQDEFTTSLVGIIGNASIRQMITYYFGGIK